MNKFRGEPVVDVSKVLPPQERFSFTNPELERLFKLSALDSIAAWDVMTIEHLEELLEREASVANRSIAEVKSDLIIRMTAVEKGFKATKNINLSIVEQVLIHLRVLKAGLE